MNYFVNDDWGKGQYYNLGEVRSHRSARIYSVVSSAAVGLCLVLLILSLWNVSQWQMDGAHVVVLNSRQSLHRETSDKFLSFGLDSSLLRDMKNLPIKDDTFVNLARHLSPAYVRIGGTSADCLFFDQAVSMPSTKATSPVDGQDISNFTITDKDLLALSEFAKRSRLNMIFDLNALIRNPDGSWNDSNAREIILFAKDHDMNVDWQLGNEPNSFRHVFNVEIVARQLARDYVKLRLLLNTSGYEGSILVGPEVNHVGDSNHKGELYAKEFLENSKDSIDYVTWHQYYLNGREARIKDFTSPTVFNYLPRQIESMADAVDASGQKIHMWLSETSTAYGGGAPELSDRFVAGFLWLDKLGYSAGAGLNVVTRQSLFGGNYSMIGRDLNPNPDWWVSVAFKEFVSEKVLRLAAPNNFGRVRLYAHCTPQKSSIGRVPAVTIYGVNLNQEPVKISIRGIYPTSIYLYALTSDHLQSRKIRMNGDTLTLRPNGDLPPFKPVILEASRTITLPSFSMSFIVLHGIDVPACTA